MSDQTFTHLHCHSYYSYMDGQNSPEEIVQFAKDMGQTAIAVTDHGTMAGHFELQAAAAKVGVKPIMGVEAYITYDRFKRNFKEKEVESKYNHIILLAKNQKGLAQLRELNSRGWSEGFYYKPRIDLELLEEYAGNIIVASGCMNGMISKAIERKQPEHAEELMAWHKERFGADFYVEVQPHNPVELNAELFRLADQFDVKPVVTADCHYTDPANADLEELMLIIATKPKLAKGANYNTSQKFDDIFDRLRHLYPERAISFEDLSVYMTDRADIQTRMEAQGWDRTDIYESTMEIADKVENVELKTGLDLLPSFSSNPVTDLRTAVREGLERIGKEDNLEYLARVEEELKVIEDKNFSTYFLIVADFVNEAKRRGIRVGPGRGSAAGSLVCYALGITKVDPIKWGTLFFRFISPDRNDYPDIDVDFEDRRRNEVKQYVADKWKNVAAIQTFSYFKDKMVVKDVARVFSIPAQTVNHAMSKIGSFEELYTSREEAVVNFRRDFPEVLAYAERLRGKIRNSGVHAAGIVISEEPLWNFVPVESAKDTTTGERIPVAAYDQGKLESIGLIKADFLGLRNLSVIEDTVQEIKKIHGVDIDPDELLLNDPDVYTELSAGNTVGIFQADAGPYRKLLRQLKPRTFGDLAASNALVRPGALTTGADKFIERLHGNEEIEYPDEILKPILESTYGVFIYQEQLMQAAVLIGGFTESEADYLRKIIGKKKDVAEFDQYREKWIENAQDYLGVEGAASMWSDFEKFAGYAFNYSHAVAYSLITYQTMWLKVHYPTEYMYALLKNENMPKKRTEFLIEAKRLGISINAPHVNVSDKEISICDHGLILGLNDVKYVSDTCSDRILEHRPFESYEHFMQVKETKNSKINSRNVAALKAVGALEFEDNLLTGTEKENYYEYLGIPVFDESQFPEYVMSKLTKAEDAVDKGTRIIYALVKDIVKKEGYSRIEMEDDTGTAVVFTRGECPDNIDKGKYYFILDNYGSLMRGVHVDEINSALKGEYTEDPFVQYIIDPDPFEADSVVFRDGSVSYEMMGGDTKVLCHAVSIHYRTTKAGKPMATAAFSSPGGMDKVLIFARELGACNTILHPGNNYIIRCTTMKDGALVLDKIITTEQYKDLKGLN